MSKSILLYLSEDYFDAPFSYEQKIKDDMHKKLGKDVAENLVKKLNSQTRIFDEYGDPKRKLSKPKMHLDKFHTPEDDLPETKKSKYYIPRYVLRGSLVDHDNMVGKHYTFHVYHYVNKDGKSLDKLND